jgi:membrane fusion protein (multidrug efflux system)
VQRANRDAARARLDAQKATVGDRVIVAPFAGVLGLRQVSPGSLVTPGTVVTTLDDTSTILLDFSVPERSLGALKVGGLVRATSDAFPVKPSKAASPRSARASMPPRARSPRAPSSTIRSAGCARACC